MTSGVHGDAARWRVGPRTVLVALAVLVLIVALLLPQDTRQQLGGERTSFSAGPVGARLPFELAGRMGWRTTRRLAPLESVSSGPPTVQVVLAPSRALGAHEVHRLLDNVRRGGGLVFTLDGGDEIADSLGLASGRAGRFLQHYGDPECPTPASARDRLLLALPPAVSRIGWRRPAPGPIDSLGMTHARIDSGFPVALGFPLGRAGGRVAVASTSALFANDVVRLCGLGADIVVARMLEYVRPASGPPQPMEFDEFHHGFGKHSGPVRAIGQYLAGTTSGRFLSQALLAGLLLVLARAPRPIVPRDPERVVRRSPLEHADALGRAYADVGATRTAASRLLAGVRRRAGRHGVAVTGVDDLAFLDSVAVRHPSLVPDAGIVRRGVTEAGSPGDLVAVGDALRRIEHQLTTSPTFRS